MGLITATRATVRSYLLKNYEVNEQQVDELLNKHAAIVTRGERLLSGAYYVGDEIAAAEKLTPLDDADEEDDNDDDWGEDDEDW